MYRVVFAAVLSASWVLIPQAWFLPIIGVALFLHTLHTRTATSLLKTALPGTVFGVTYAACALLWFWDILPLDWIDAGLIGGTLVLFLSWLFVAGAMGSIFGLFSIAYRRFGSLSVLSSLFFASLWVLLEYAQMWIFAFLTWGTASAKSAHFSATFIGYALASFSPLLQLSYIGGVYILSFTIVFVGACAHIAYTKIISPRIKIIAIIVTVCVCTTVATLDARFPIISTRTNTSAETIRVGLVTTQFSHKRIRDYESRNLRHEEQKNLVASALNNAPPIDLLVFPEGAANFTEGDTEVNNFLRDVFPERRPAIIDSSVTFENGGRLQRMFYWSPEAKLSGTYDKVFLVPQGEYTPNITYIVFRLIGMFEVVEKIKRVSPGFIPGSNATAVEINNVSIGGLFCSDVLSPQLYKRQTRDGAEILVNAASHALFHNSPIVDAHILAVSKVRAVENGRYLLVSGNGVSSSVISNSGEILRRSPKGESSVLIADIPRKKNLTPFTILGDNILWFPALVCLIYIDRKMIALRSKIGANSADY